MPNSIFSILITTKNCLNDLSFTLAKIDSLIKEKGVSCIVFDKDAVPFFN